MSGTSTLFMGKICPVLMELFQVQKDIMLGNRNMHCDLSMSIDIIAGQKEGFYYFLHIFP